MRPRSFLVAALVFSLSAPSLAQGTGERWVGTWATALVARALPPAAPPAAPPATAPAPAASGQPGPPAGPAAAPGGGGRFGGPPPLTVNNQTLRQIVRTSVGGSRVRVVLSNVFGTSSIAVGAADIAPRSADASVVVASVKPITFGGAPSATILAGAVLVSDPIEMTVAPLSDLVVDLYLPGEVGTGPSPVTTHNGASQTNYLSQTGDHTGAAVLPSPTRTGSWFLLARIEVMAPTGAAAVVAFGDSITDGARSTVDANGRWPDHLARRLAASGRPVGVLNAGISGNRVLSDGAGVSALARFDKDVLMQTGVTHVVVMEGINDIGLARANPSPSAADLIAGHKQLIERARARGLKIYGATLTPFEGAAYFTPEGEAKRQALNEWIRTSKAYDGVIDFDAVTRDPAAPSRFLPAYDSGDHLHPGDAGYKAMGEAVDLALFR
jgi:lysophospholipase L1-like esterase